MSNFNNLTGKQETFALACLNPDNSASNAYRLAYNAGNMSPAAVHVEASRLLSHPMVALRIRELRDQVTAGKVWSFGRAMAEVETNIELARQANQHSAAHRATETALKLSGLMTDRPKDEGVRITKVTVVLSQEDPEDDTPALEASYRVLPPADEAE